MENIVNRINDLMWGIPMIVFLFGTHLYLTWRTGFVQKHIFQGIRDSLKSSNAGNGDLSIFGSLMTALSSTVGTGNIIGVGTAVALGGPGAVLWTWLGGLFGIATKYAESYIAVKHRRRNEDGSYIGGAMTAFEHLHMPLAARIFAVCCALGAFGIGCSSQANAIVDILNSSFSVSRPLVGATVALGTFIVIFGGIKSISRVCEKLVPLMSVIYIIGCLGILIYNGRYLPETIALIVSSAFTTKAMSGGFVGTTMMIAARYGIARGLFSNEAGMGSAPIATAVSDADNAVKPALVGATGVFWDTVVICLLTGLVLVSCVISNGNISAVELSSGGALVSACFGIIPVIGRPLLIFGILTFSYSTILGWSYYGEACITYLFGKKAVRYYQLLWIAVIYIGATSSLNVVWTIADILNAAMCIPNVIAVLLLSKEIAADTRYYLHEGHLNEKDPEMQ